MLASTNEQAENLERVSRRIGKLIVSFCRERLKTRRPEFHMVEMTTWLAQYIEAAPDSASRILRYLKAQGVVKYDLVSRRSSLYRITAVTS